MNIVKNMFLDLIEIRRYASLVRIKKFDTSTETGRHNERLRRIALSIVSNVLSKTLGVMVMILSVSLTMPYLGPERFGIWMTISSIAAVVSFLDFGIGNVLTNYVATKASLDVKEHLREAVTLGIVVLVILGGFAAFLLWFLSGILPWETLLKLKEPQFVLEAQSSAKVFAILFGFNVVTNGILKIFAGLQESYYGHLASALGSITSIIGLWLGSYQHVGVTFLLAVMMGGQIVSGLILSLFLFNRKLIGLTKFANFKKLEIFYLFRSGLLFFMLQIGTMVSYGMDSLIISGTLGLVAVSTFNITQRLFYFISQPLMMINAPLWGAYADAHSRKDKKFILKTLKKSLFLTSIFSLVAGFTLVFFGEQIILIWTKRSLSVPFSLILIFWIWTFCQTLGNAFAMLLNGCNIVASQVRSVLLFIVIAIPSKIFFVKYGLNTYLLVATISYLIAVPFYLYFFERPHLKKIFI